jgi:hypothetical protein
MPPESERIDKLELDFVGIRHEMATNNQTLREIKDVLVRQADILSTVTYVKETVNQVKESVKSLEETFERRKEITEQNNRTFLEFMNRSKGALAVCLILFSVVQGFIISEYKEREGSYKELEAELKKLEKEVIILQTSKSFHGDSISNRKIK